MSLFTELRNTVYLRRIARSLERLEKLYAAEQQPPKRRTAKLVHMDVVDSKAVNERYERQIRGEEPEVDG